MTCSNAQDANSGPTSPGTSPQSAPPVAKSPSKSERSESSPKSSANVDIDGAPQFQPAEHWQELALQNDGGDAESALGDDSATSTASLSSSIMQYRTILGRTFHAEQGNAEYWYPHKRPEVWQSLLTHSRASNDQQQNESMDV